jgi:hypothetical protein
MMVHLVDPIGGGCGQTVQEHSGHSHILVDLGKGWMHHPFVVDGGDDGPGPIPGFGVVDGGGSVRPQGGLTSM